MEGRQTGRRADALSVGWGPGRRRFTPGRVAAVVVAIIALLLVIAQLVLPGIAADRLRTKLEKHGQVQEVSVSAFPAIELLWNQASSVTVRMSTYRDHVPSPGNGQAAKSTSTSTSTHAPPPTAAAQIGPAHRLANLLASTSHTDSLDARVGVLQTGKLVLDDVVLTKSGNTLTASALLTQAHINAALPQLFTLRPVSSSTGELAFRGTAHVLGVGLSLTAVLHPHNGALLVSPEIAGFVPSFLSLTVFSDPRIAVDSVASRQVAGGWEISARGHLT